MLPRSLPPVHSPVRPVSLAKAAATAIFDPRFAFAKATDALRERFGVEPAALTDSGTSALALALRVSAPSGVVAMPGYACIHLVAAAAQARVRVTLYDLDSRTLSPDLRSLERAIESGASAVVAAHLFGYPVDIDAVREICSRRGVVFVEDAAQGIGGYYGGKPLGAHGDLAVLSFGRGKGVNAAGGGALLASGDWIDRVRSQSVAVGGSSWMGLLTSAAQWALGRPGLYAAPLAVPSLRLGEMVYEPAHAPRGLSVISAALLPEALALGAAAAVGRRARAVHFAEALRETGAVAIVPVSRAQSGALRFPVLLPDGTPIAKRLGAYRPYPLALGDHAATAEVLAEAPDTPQSQILAARLFTLPTHEQLTNADESALVRWAARQVSRKGGDG